MLFYKNYQFDTSPKTEKKQRELSRYLYLYETLFGKSCKKFKHFKQIKHYYKLVNNELPDHFN